MIHEITKQKLNKYISEFKITYETVENVNDRIKN